MKFISKFFKGIATMISNITKSIIGFFKAIVFLISKFIKSIFNFFNKSYPKDGLDLSVVLQALIALLITLAICYFFNPFGFETFNQLLISGGIAFGLSLLMSILTYFMSKGSTRWTMTSQILKQLVLLLLIAVACFVYFEKSINWESIGFFSILGLILAFIYSIFNLNIAENKYSNLANNANDSLKSMKVENINFKSISLEAKDGKKINLLPNQLISLQENNGSVEITWQNMFNTEVSILNNSLKNIEKSVADYGQFIKCNSSTIVNKYAIKNVSGTAQGISLEIAKAQNAIQVDRTKANDLCSKL